MLFKVRMVRMKLLLFLLLVDRTWAGNVLQNSLPTSKLWGCGQRAVTRWKGSWAFVFFYCILSGLKSVLRATSTIQLHDSILVSTRRNSAWEADLRCCPTVNNECSTFNQTRKLLFCRPHLGTQPLAKFSPCLLALKLWSACSHSMTRKLSFRFFLLHPFWV